MDSDMRAGQPTLTISIVNHGNRDETLSLLEVLADLLDRPEVDIVVLDNASEDGSAEAIASAHPAVRLIAQTQRAGFGANHNTVIRQTDTDYVLLLNDDATMGAENVDCLVEYMEAHPRVAAAGPRIISRSGTRLQTAWAHLGPARAALFAATAGQVAWIQSEGDAPRPVGRLSGCALMLRRAALPVPPVFDEGYFMYAEDSDLCLRLHAAGHEVHFVPAAVVTHRGRQSSAAVPARRRVEQSRSTHRYLGQHYGPIAGAFTRAALALGYTEKAVAAAILLRVLRRPVSGAVPGEFMESAKDALRVPAGAGLRELADEYNEGHGPRPHEPGFAGAPGAERGGPRGG
jgi:GT2 family glycosyltransferase